MLLGTLVMFQLLLKLAKGGLLANSASAVPGILVTFAAYNIMILYLGTTYLPLRIDHVENDKIT